MGAGTSPVEREFFCVVMQTTSTFLQLRNGGFSPNLVTKRISVSRRGIRKDSLENFHVRGHFPTKSENKSRSNRHLTQSRLQVTGCTAERYCVLHAEVQGPVSFQVRSTFLYDVQLRSYGASKLPNFRILAYFPLTKPLKRTILWPAYSPGVTSQNDYDLVVEGPKGSSGSAVFLRLLVGELGTPKLAQSFAYGKCLYPYRILLYGTSNLDQRCLKTDVLSHQISSTLSPKSRENPIFGDLL